MSSLESTSVQLASEIITLLKREIDCVGVVDETKWQSGQSEAKELHDILFRIFSRDWVTKCAEWHCVSGAQSVHQMTKRLHAI